MARAVDSDGSKVYLRSPTCNTHTHTSDGCCCCCCCCCCCVSGGSGGPLACLQARGTDAPIYACPRSRPRSGFDDSHGTRLRQQQPLGPPRWPVVVSRYTRSSLPHPQPSWASFSALARAPALPCGISLRGGPGFSRPRHPPRFRNPPSPSPSRRFPPTEPLGSDSPLPFA